MSEPSSQTMFTPIAAARWLATRLGRPVSRQLIHVYIKAGDLPATDIGGGDQRAHWIIHRADLEAFVQKVEADAGRFPPPTGGWPQRTRRPKEGDERPKKLTV